MTRDISYDARACLCDRTSFLNPAAVVCQVLYLGLMQALDKKQEMDDKQLQGSRLKAAPGTK